MKKFSPVILAAALLALVWTVYYGNFGGALSKDPGEWGVFGDYTGGVLNPLLNFITIYLLIKSLSFQEKQIEIAKSEADEARNDLAEARRNEALRSYESSLLTFAQVAIDEYKSFSLPGLDGTLLKSGEAVTYLQERLLSAERSKNDFDKLINEIDQSNHECIYSLVRSFCALFKLTVDICPEQERARYVDMISLIIPTKAQFLLFMMEAYSGWRILEQPRGLGFFDREANKEALDAMKSLIKAQ
ncbi:hypothetical protein ACFPTX_05635 [Pseudomonas sp. GCM10022188]|uniref:hypothetical protein n=1 Tax=Pseudomonas TaxID=286 RepID=UPI001E2B124B|nr:hypothetical protein [Pseudomonas oryzagri]MCC6077165.1 hypothetical protein [Pseudomonas oryzagri]